MIVASIICFALAAVFGIILLTYVLSNKETPKAIAFIHGGFAATALVLLIIHALQHMDDTLWIAGLFVVVALVGFYMLSRDLTGKLIPKAVAIIHGLVAATGLLALIYLVFLVAR